MEARARARRLTALALIGLTASTVMAAVVGADVTHTPAASAASTRGLTRARPAACPFPRLLHPAFTAAAHDSNLPPALLYAVAKVESNLQPDVVSEAGARGLLQVMPGTGKMLALDIDEPTSNVLAGSRYLRQMIDRFGSTDMALAAYNAGPTAVATAGRAPTAAVQTYVSNVTSLWRLHAGCR